MSIHNKFMPVYRDLKAMILNKEYKTGQLIPSETILCETFNTSRPTVRIALTKLVNDGYISKQKGVGSTVLPPKIERGVLTITQESNALDPIEAETVIIQKPQRITWPETFPFALSEEELAQNAIFFERIRKVGKKVITTEKAYILDNGIQDFMTIDLASQSLFKTFEMKFNIEIRGGNQTLKIVLANEQEAQLFGVEVNTPLLQVQRKIQTSRKMVFIYSFMLCNTQEYKIEESI